MKTKKLIKFQINKATSLLGFFFLFNVMPAFATVKLASVFGNEMVLQQKQENPIWGVANPGEIVTVSINGQTVSAAANGSGDWKVMVGPFNAGGPYTMTVTGASNALQVTNILLGEVWICSGQSNMFFPLSKAANSTVEIQTANYPKIRLLSIPRMAKATPQTTFTAPWKVCTPTSVKEFSAVAYFFGRHLHKTLGVPESTPIGLIQSAFNGSTGEAWTSREALLSERVLVPLVKLFDKKGMSPEVYKTPTALYNGMISPLIPFGIRGVIWYQGEGNFARAEQYQTLFPTLIEDWRERWGQPMLPFLFVQIANYGSIPTTPVESARAELREAQFMTLSQPKTAMVVTLDIGESLNLHPKNKLEVGNRLGLAARSVVYGESLVSSGPLAKSMTIEGNTISIDFESVGGGLVSKDNAPLKGFSIAGIDRKFVWASATIVGNRVMVSNGAVSQPVAVRYAWGDSPECNLYNIEGLPASSFRTDRWPGITAGVLVPKTY